MPYDFRLCHGFTASFRCARVDSDELGREAALQARDTRARPEEPPHSRRCGGCHHADAAIEEWRAAAVGFAALHAMPPLFLEEISLSRA